MNQRALRQFSVEEITEGFAAARGLALPSQLRHLLRAQGRNLHAEFVRLLPSPPQPIRVQRWSARRIGLWAAILALPEPSTRRALLELALMVAILLVVLILGLVGIMAGAGNR